MSTHPDDRDAALPRRDRFPNALIALGALGGATLGWLLGPYAGIGFLLGAHTAVIVGFAVLPTRRRATAAVLSLLIIWWPVWLGQFLWD